MAPNERFETQGSTPEMRESRSDDILRHSLLPGNMSVVPAVARVEKSGGNAKGESTSPFVRFRRETLNNHRSRETEIFSIRFEKSQLQRPLQIRAAICKESFLPFSKGKNHASGAISPLICGGCLRNALVINARYPRPIAPQTKPSVIELDSRFSHSAPTVSAPITGRIR